MVVAVSDRLVQTLRWRDMTSHDLGRAPASSNAPALNPNPFGRD
jgi:hypothetical protein